MDFQHRLMDGPKEQIPAMNRVSKTQKLNLFEKIYLVISAEFIVILEGNAL